MEAALAGWRGNPRNRVGSHQPAPRTPHQDHREDPYWPPPELSDHQHRPPRGSGEWGSAPSLKGWRGSFLSIDHVEQAESAWPARYRRIPRHSRDVSYTCP